MKTNSRSKKNSKSKSTLSKWQVSHPELKPGIPCGMSELNSIRRSLEKRSEGVQELYTTILNYQAIASSDSSGNFAPVFTSNPSSCPDWSKFSGDWDEYRVLGIEATFEPILAIGGSTVQNRAPLVVASDYDDSTPLIGYNVGNLYSDSQRFDPMKKFVKLMANPSLTDNGFLSITSSNVTMTMKVWSSGNTISTPLYIIFLRFFVQFRGRGI
jgi:hypothetical protein